MAAVISPCAPEYYLLTTLDEAPALSASLPSLICLTVSLPSLELSLFQYSDKSWQADVEREDKSIHHLTAVAATRHSILLTQTPQKKSEAWRTGRVTNAGHGMNAVFDGEEPEEGQAVSGVCYLTLADPQ
ncbi:hypothetical protein NQZ68_014427 [Dissostichus eleginoides]|nr:hypothetical protein NQZ68_014427 [Dissostichus eleginoides]